MARTPYIADVDFTLYVGDVREVLRDLPDESVHAVVTSPPYWGLRDYGNPGQIGLEDTPDEYVENMVTIFREVHRVLRNDGTCWLNLGDTYAGGGGGNYGDGKNVQTHKNNPVKSKLVGVGAGVKQKDLIGIPWAVAFALRTDGWYLRSEIIWAKGLSFRAEDWSGAVMPESVQDRPTRSHEQVFLLTKSPSYYYDINAVREEAKWERWGAQTNDKHRGAGGTTTWIENKSKEELQEKAEAGRNLRSVWAIGLKPYSGAHFAVFPQLLIEPMIKAGTSEKGCCPQCASPWEREVVTPVVPAALRNRDSGAKMDYHTRQVGSGQKLQDWRNANPPQTVGWQPTCECFGWLYRWRDELGGQQETYVWRDLADEARVAKLLKPAVVMDPFMGSGTTAHVARSLHRHSVGIELSPEYAELIANRTRQLSLLS